MIVTTALGQDNRRLFQSQSRLLGEGSTTSLETDRLNLRLSLWYVLVVVRGLSAVVAVA